MRSLVELADIMRRDWNRRVRHDYRFWIGNETAHDSLMWEEGRSDFEAISAGIDSNTFRTALEIGCGVGRMMRAAAQKFDHVTGVDISSLAIEKATELIASKTPGVRLFANSGYDLKEIADASIDFVYSFAALSHMPVRVIASYLREIKRVLKPQGCARLQLFFGVQDTFFEADTLRLRAFQEEDLRKALGLAGFSLNACTPIKFPLQELLDELELQPVLITIESIDSPTASLEVVAQALLPGGEGSEADGEPCSTFEAWLALNYADKLYSDGNFDRARDTLEYVAQHCQAAGIDVRDTLEKISSVAGKKDVSANLASANHVQDIYRANLAIVERRFPELFTTLIQSEWRSDELVEIRATPDGPTLWKAGTCLDNPEKPRAGAEAWVTRAMKESRFEKVSHIIVVGFGSGYHLETLVARATHSISCIEPSLAVLRSALMSRDLRTVLEKLEQLSVNPDVKSLRGADDAELLVRPQSKALSHESAEQITSSFYGRRGLSVLNPKIAVLGPLHGGSLPIGQYTTAALSRLGQRARGIDMSGFDSAHQLVSSLVNDDGRRSLLRQTYVETLSSMLLESFAEKPIDILICMAQAPISARALLELRRQGVITVLWFVEDYLRFTYWREMAKYYDYVFTIQKGECIDAIKRAGAGHAHYLPTACDPRFHVPQRLTTEEQERWGAPISFVGAGYHNRQQMFAGLVGYPFKIWGSEWPLCKPFDRMVQEDSRRIAPEEYLKIFSGTEINLNLHSSNERDGVDPTGDFLNPRTFELAACGAFQLVDERSLLSEAFEVGKEIITFNSLPDLKSKIDYFLEHPEERREIAEKARARVSREHTYDNRIAEMLSVIYSHSFEKLKARESNSPWTEMIRKAECDPELRSRCEKAFKRGEEPVLDGLVADIVTGQGQLTETEQKLLFLFHVRKQIIRMDKERSEGAN